MTSWTDELAATAPDAETEFEPTPDADALARELAKLPLLEYDRRRQTEADRLGVRVSSLDTEVARHRGQPPTEEPTTMFPEDDPWPDQVDGGELLDALCATYDQYVRFSSSEARDAAALWTILAHAHGAAMISPILAIESPEKRCGKTTLLSTVALLVPRALPAVNCSPSVIFRAIEKFKPTILIDEGDTFLRENDDLRGILNGGHNRLTAFVLRNVDVGGDYEPRRFNVWSPKVIALIGDLPETLQDRSVIIHMRRKLPNETVDRFRADRVTWADGLRRQTARWAADHIRALKDADPDVPAQLHDRAADNWRTMLAIADMCGWGERARQAALVLSGSADADEDNAAIMLLHDIREIFESPRHSSAISPRELAEQLIVAEGRPWADWRAGKPISDRSVGRLLTPFGIKSRRSHKSRLFHRTDFEDAWNRYLRPAWGDRNDANDTALKTKGNSESQTTRPKPSRVVCNPEKANEINGASFASSEKGGEAEDVPFDPEEFEERAAILEYEAGMSRAEAERQAVAETSTQIDGE